MINIGKVVKLRKSGDSLIITMPKQIAEMFDLKEDSEVELKPFTANQILMEKVK